MATSLSRIPKLTEPHSLTCAVRSIHAALNCGDLAEAAASSHFASKCFPNSWELKSLVKAIRFTRYGSHLPFWIRRIGHNPKPAHHIEPSFQENQERSQLMDLFTACFLKLLDYRANNPHVNSSVERLSHQWVKPTSPQIYFPRDEIVVTAIVSAYNSAAYLPACLENLRNQTLGRKLEILVIDSASPQNEGQIVNSFQERIPNLRYIRTIERETLYAAWNRGVAEAKGRYVTNANTDDSHRPDALELLARALDCHPEADLAYADNFWTNFPNETWESQRVRQRLVAYPDYHPASSLHWCTLGPHPVWRRTLFDAIGGFNPRFRAAGDFEFQMRFTAHNKIAVHVPLPLSLFYQNTDGLTFADATSTIEATKAMEHWRRIVKIENLFKIDVDDPVSIASGWTALGRSSLRCRIPWANQASFPALALDAFLKAQQQLPSDPYIRACVKSLMSSGPSWLYHTRVMRTVFTSNLPSSALVPPPPATPALQWLPDGASLPIQP